jgi:hypothetical protein
MMRTSICAIIAFTVSGIALSTLLRSGQGELIVEQPSLDWGIRTAGELVEQHVLLINRGSDECRILGTAQSCTCVTPKNVPAALAPGESADVVVVIDTLGRVGAMSSRVVFDHDGRNGPKAIVDLHGTVVDGLVLNPQRWILGEGLAMGGECPSVVVDVSTDNGVGLDGLGVADQSGLFHVKLEEWDGRAARRRVRIGVEEPMPRGRFHGTVAFTVGTLRRDFIVEGELVAGSEGVPTDIAFHGDMPGRSMTSFTVVAVKDDDIMIERCPSQIECALGSSAAGGADVTLRLRDTNKSTSGFGYLLLRVLGETSSSLGVAEHSYRIQVPLKWEHIRPYADD